ncbi:hypothetical protein GQF01_00770 [Paenibacillus sp. 5J-6]|uniref:tRNA nuclease CdiA C-terminal domain-containing protein n=1 Tax=Paenibacillus silvestris TaxID=2606219 RepID=A0A6L8URV9_9BACL|nr:hypothetical protein [Paenibacillus silvestris]MZQ80687.1 hypothetical protein [Paenibacillus silvestris]
MPEKNSHLTTPDPIVMNKDVCESIVYDFLKEKGFQFKAVDSRNDADLCALKSGYKLLVETRGNQAKAHNADTVFDSAQLSIHLAEQVQVLLKLFDPERSILVLANPDIPRIQKQVASIYKALEHLKIVCFWVQPNGTIRVQYPTILSEYMRLLDLS